jgi:hypothetical protein
MHNGQKAHQDHDSDSETERVNLRKNLNSDSDTLLHGRGGACAHEDIHTHGMSSYGGADRQTHTQSDGEHSINVDVDMQACAHTTARASHNTNNSDHHNDNQPQNTDLNHADSTCAHTTADSYSSSSTNVHGKNPDDNNDATHTDTLTHDKGCSHTGMHLDTENIPGRDLGTFREPGFTESGAAGAAGARTRPPGYARLHNNSPGAVNMAHVDCTADTQGEHKVSNSESVHASRHGSARAHDVNDDTHAKNYVSSHGHRPYAGSANSDTDMPAATQTQNHDGHIPGGQNKASTPNDLSHENGGVCHAKRHAKGYSITSVLMGFIRDRRPLVRLYASKCVAHLVGAGVFAVQGDSSGACDVVVVVHTAMKLLSEQQG